MQLKTLGLGALVLICIAGCKPSAPTVGPASDEPARSAATAKPDSHPCALLSDASVANAVPGTRAGQRDAGDEGYGIAACRWSVGDGAVVMQVFDAGPGALAQELRSSALEIVDIRRPDAATLVRLERFEDIGEMAGAYVERADAKRGIARSAAVLMVQQGGRLAVLRIPQLAAGDRKEALEAMKALGSDIAKGL